MRKSSRKTALVRIAMTVLAVVSTTYAVSVPNVAAIPAFARKYTLNCTACHTAPPRLNTFGERFLENGYQLPGTEDGGITGKQTLGDLSLDDFANYTGVRLRGNVLRGRHFKQQNPLTAEAGVVQNNIELGFPEIFSLFTAGSLTKNIGFFAELESNLEESSTGIERAFLTFNNLGGTNVACNDLSRSDPRV